jgi:GT2 family glycosyltransferase
MKPDAIFLDGASGLGMHARLGGLYRVEAAPGVEIELIEDATFRRSLIYGGAGTRILSVPAADYRLYVRSACHAPARARLHAMGPFAKAGFVVAKAVEIVRRGPRGVLAAVRRISKRADVVTGARVGAGSADAASAGPLPDGRAVITPVAVPDDMRAASIVIPTRDSVEMLKACIGSLARTTGVALEIIVVDNGATRPEARAYLAELAERPEVRVLRLDIPFNFSRLCNAGATLARHPVLVFLNDDVEVCDEAWLECMLGYLARPDTGIAGARLLYPSGDLQHAGVASNLVPGPGHPWRGQPAELWKANPYVTVSGEVDAVTAACLAIRRDLFTALGGFDEETFAITVNDVDLCLRARGRGLKTVYAAEAELIHKEGQSREADDRPDQAARRNAELKAYVERYPEAARESCFYPRSLRRDSDAGLPIE